MLLRYLFILSASLVLSAVASARATYYVSSSAGDDRNTGLTESAPLKTLARASQIEFGPGDSLLLKKGDLWEGESLLPKGSGTKEKPIVISGYGAGTRRPHIRPGYSALYGIRIVNAAGYVLSGIEISEVMGGIVVWEENNYDYEFLRIEDCYLHDMTNQHHRIPLGVPDLLYGMGISIAGSDAHGGRTLLSDIHICGCEFDRCDVGIEVIGRDHDPSGQWRRHGHDKISRFAFRDVYISDCDIRKSYRSGGVMLYCLTGGKSERVRIDQTGYEGVGMWWGVCAFQTARVSDYLVENCTFENTVKGSSPDGQGFDWEADVHNVVVRNCRIVNNDGPATLNFGGTWKGENDGCVLDGCYIAANNRSVDGDYVGKVFGVGRPQNEGIIKNCEIHLRTDDQNFYCFPMVFDESNRVYDTSGNLVYKKPDRTKPCFTGQRTEWEAPGPETAPDGTIAMVPGEIRLSKKGAGWSRCFHEARLAFDGAGEAGLVFGARSARECYVLKAVVAENLQSRIELVRVAEGTEKILGSVQAHGLRPGRAFTLRANPAGNRVEIYANGNLMGAFETPDPVKGRVAIYAGKGGPVRADRLFTHPLE